MKSGFIKDGIVGYGFYRELPVSIRLKKRLRASRSKFVQKLAEVARELEIDEIYWYWDGDELVLFVDDLDKAKEIVKAAYRHMENMLSLID